MSRPTFCFRQKNIFIAIIFLIRFCNKFRNFCALPLLVFKNGHCSFLQTSCSCRICVNPNFPQTFDRMIFGRLNCPRTLRYEVTVLDPQMVLDQEKFGNHCSNAWT